MYAECLLNSLKVPHVFANNTGRKQHHKAGNISCHRYPVFHEFVECSIFVILLLKDFMHFQLCLMMISSDKTEYLTWDYL